MMTRPAFPAEDFYRTQLRLGSEAFQSQKYADAIDPLRIASFGLLDDPVRLSEALAKLALSQTAVGRSHDAKQTIERFVEAEQHFKSYASAALDDETRKSFDALLLKNLPPEARNSVPTLATIGPSRLDEINAMPPRERRKALQAEAVKHPEQVIWQLALARDAASRNDHNAAVQYATRALAIEDDNAAALELRARAKYARRDYKGALADLGALPESVFAGDAKLAAARFVSAVESSDWKSATAFASSLSEEIVAAPEVARAKKKLAAATAAPASAASDESKPSDTNQTPADGAVSQPDSAQSSAPPPQSSTPPPTAGKETAPPQAENNIPVLSQNRGKNSFTPPDAPPPSAATNDAIARGRRLVAKGRYADAEKLLYDAVRKDSARRDVRLALLEASCLAGDWQTGAAQVSLLQPFRAGEEASMFYAAASYYELGKVQEARVLLRLALPGLAPNEMVDRYAKRILESGD